MPDDPGGADSAVDDATPDDPGDPYLIDLNNGWLVTGEEHHSFTLFVTPFGKVGAAIIGGSEFVGDPALRLPLDGLRENCRIHFTSTLGSNVVTYDGVLGDDGRVHLTASPGGAHILLH